MIKCENGLFIGSGTEIDLLLDFSVIVKSLNDHLSKAVGESESKRLLKKFFNLGFSSEKEISERSSMSDIVTGTYDRDLKRRWKWC